MRFEKLFSEIDQLNEQEHFNGAMALVTPNETLFEKTYGLADFDSQTPFTVDTTSALGSVTKQFTAVALLKLVEAGKLNLDETLATFLPKYSHAHEVTIRQMLNMASGIPDYTDVLIDKMIADAKQNGLSKVAGNVKVGKEMGADFPISQILDLINPLPLEFVPSSKFTYSNSNYALLTQVLEIVSQTDYATFVQTHILNPEHLTHTFSGTEKADAISYVTLENHRYSLGKGNHQLGDGSLVTNIRDFELWAQAILNGHLPSKQSWSTVFNIQQDGYALGWWTGRN
ncbi:MAG TPA: hypothetical protein DCW31_07395, partial [Lactobacillus sp.]|nr:hypothetical protein [Lactobacillus sp.]